MLWNTYVIGEQIGTQRQKLFYLWLHSNLSSDYSRLVDFFLFFHREDLCFLFVLFCFAFFWAFFSGIKFAQKRTVRANAKMHQTISGKSPEFVFSPTFIHCSPIYPNNCGIVFFLWKYILVFEKWVFSFDRSNMQIFTLNITRVVWPHVTNLLDLRYFCQHNPLFYHLNLIPCHCWSWQRNIYFWWIFLSDILCQCRKVASKQRQL